MLNQRVEHLAQSGLMQQQKTDHAKLRKLPRFGHAQAKVLATGKGCRVFQNAPGDQHINHLIWFRDHGWTQSRAAQSGIRVST